MPLYRVRRERCIPYEFIVKADNESAAEAIAYAADDSAWSEDCAYWQDIQTEELDEDEYEDEYEDEDEDEDEEGEEDAE